MHCIADNHTLAFSNTVFIFFAIAAQVPASTIFALDTKKCSWRRGWIEAYGDDVNDAKNDDGTYVHGCTKIPDLFAICVLVLCIICGGYTS
jgi:hypothetical protein